jgi:hypothetical protein
MYFHDSAAFKKKPRQTRESKQGNTKNKKRPVELPRQTAVKLTVSDVHGDFETETHVACCRCLPFHGVSPMSAADYGESCTDSFRTQKQIFNCVLLFVYKENL